MLLIVPHLVALSGLFVFAYRNDGSADADERDSGPDEKGPPSPPEPPAPAPSGDRLPLPISSPPRRRLQRGERLADLHPQPPRRRELEPSVPERAPVTR